MIHLHTAHRGARMALCSGSIGIIDGIVPPAYVFRRAGGLVALGLDHASGNNCNNIFYDLKVLFTVNTQHEKAQYLFFRNILRHCNKGGEVCQTMLSAL